MTPWSASTPNLRPPPPSWRTRSPKGKITAARRPLHGPDHVARWLLGVLAKPMLTGIELDAATVNGELGLVGVLGEYPVGAITFDLVDGRIQNVRFQVNPDKLAGLAGLVDRDGSGSAE